MASIARTNTPQLLTIRFIVIASFRSLRIILTTLLLASIVLDGLQALEMTFGRSKSDSHIEYRRSSPSHNEYRRSSPSHDEYRRSSPSHNEYRRSNSSRSAVPPISRSPTFPSYWRSRSMSPVRDCSSDYKFDFLMLTLMWSPGTCSTSAQTCVHENASRFTIHGLWPQRLINNRNSEGPENCCFQNNFVIEYLKPIMPALDQWWPSYFASENKFFWSHEWQKHGTCTKNVDALSGELKYFGTTVNLVKKLQILETLKKANIVPSDVKKYDSSSIVNALKMVHNKKAIQIDCDYEHDHPVPLITGLNFCYDEQLNPTDCPEMKRKCSRQSLKFPATVSRLFADSVTYKRG